MRILIAPDSYGSLVDARAAADAIASGWSSVADGDALDRAPMSDGGPGFVSVMRSALGGELVSLYVSDPIRRQRHANVLIHGQVAWIESASACGLHLLAQDERDPLTSTTKGVGELVLLSIARGVKRCVIGLGGSATNDGGAGAWSALGAEPAERLTCGGAGLRGLADLVPAHVPDAVEIVIATDVDNRLLGPAGASAVFGPQKGADRQAVLDLDDSLRDWADVVERVTGRPGLRHQPGSGAAGGLGFGLMALGASRVGGAEVVIDSIDLRRRVLGCDLVVTGEGRLDASSLRGKVVSAVARVAQDAGIPCIAIAGEVSVGERETGAWGIDAAYSVAELAGSVDAAMASGALGIEAVSRLAARDWSRRG